MNKWKLPIVGQVHPQSVWPSHFKTNSSGDTSAAESVRGVEETFPYISSEYKHLGEYELVLRNMSSKRNSSLSAYHQVLDSSFSNADDLRVSVGGSRLMPVAKAVLTASPAYIYDTCHAKI